MFVLSKSKAIIALFLSIIMLSSVVIITDGQQNLISNSMDAKNLEIDLLGDNATDINAIGVDVKVQKYDEFNPNNSEWFDKIRIYVEDIVRFKITVNNICKYDLINVQVIDKLPPSNIMIYILESSTVNGEPQKPLIQDTGDGERLIWDIDEFLSNREIVIIFGMEAVDVTEIGGVRNEVSVSFNLNPRYAAELAAQKGTLTSMESQAVNIVNDIVIQQDVISGLDLEIDQLTLQEAEVNQQIDDLTQEIQLKELEAGAIESQIISIISDIDTTLANKAVKEQLLGEAQASISDKESLLQIKSDYILLLEADLQVELDELIVLQGELSKAIEDSHGFNQTILDILDLIAAQEISISSLIQNIGTVESERDTINAEIVQLSEDEGQLELLIADLEAQYTLKLLEKDDLDLQNQSIIVEIDTLNAEKDLKILDQQNLLGQISTKEGY